MWIICMHFERIIHSIRADFAPQRLLFFRHYTMPCAYQSKRRACVRVKTSHMRIKDSTAICNWTKEQTRPEFQLGRLLWKARVIILFRKKRSVLHWKEELEKRHRPEFDTPRQSKRYKPPPLPPRYLVVSVWRSILEFIIVPVMLSY